MSQPQQSFSDRVADIILQVVKMGGLPVGGITGLWLLLSDGGLLKAVTSMGIGLSISYGAKLLQPLHKGNEERLERAGEALNSGVEWVTSRAIAAATGFESKYLLCQAADCQSLRPEGVPQHEGIFVPLLKDVFVPLSLDLNPISPGFRQLQSQYSRFEGEISLKGLSIWKLIEKSHNVISFRQIAVLAWGGYGKTTLLKHIAYTYGTQQHPSSVQKLIPVLLILREHRDRIAQYNPPDLPTLITEYHIPNLPEASDLNPPEGWAKLALRRGRMIIMLDGFDEVAKNQRPLVAKWINEQARQYSKSVFILTSRPKAYRDKDASTRLHFPAMFWVDDFNATQRKDFVEKWYRCQESFAHMRSSPDVKKIASDRAQDLITQIEARSELQLLATNPLLLNMISMFHRRYPDAKLPERRVELYKEICQLQLRDRPRARALGKLLTKYDTQTLLQQLAYGMMSKRWERIPRPNIMNAFNYFLSQQEEDFDAEEFLEQVVQISELIVQQEDVYEFAHLSFQEYLASAHLAKDHKREAILYEHLEDDWWKPTILLYVSQTNSTSLIREALRRGLDDLAHACLQETTKKVGIQAESELKQLTEKVKARRYFHLREYLKNCQWSEASEETYRLMITAVGKEEGQSFADSELLNFPCDELLTIDNLWVKYQGYFILKMRLRMSRPNLHLRSA